MKTVLSYGTETIPWILLGGVPAGILAIVATSTGDLGEPAIRAGLRYTARWSFALFIAAYVVPSLLAQPTSLARSGRREGQLFASLAASHIVHLGLIAWLFVSVTKSSFGVPVILVGGTGYLFIAATLLLSCSGRAIEAVGEGAFLRVRALTLHVIWSVFVLFYISQTSAGQHYGPTLLVVALLALGCRLVAAHWR